MAKRTYTGVLVGVGSNEVALSRVAEVPIASAAGGTVRQLAGGGRRAVSSPNTNVVVTVLAEELPHASLATLRGWQGQVVRVRFAWRAPLWCYLSEISESTTRGSLQHNRSRAAGVKLVLMATTATAADAG